MSVLPIAWAGQQRTARFHSAPRTAGLPHPATPAARARLELAIVTGCYRDPNVRFEVAMSDAINACSALAMLA